MYDKSHPFIDLFLYIFIVIHQIVTINDIIIGQSLANK